MLCVTVPGESIRMLVDRAAAQVEQPTIERVRSISWIAPAIAASSVGTGGARPGSAPAWIAIRAQ
jgi:hypothetical protein